MAVRTGEQFLQGLRDGREVWLEGERVEDVTTHPKLTRMAHTLADIYDLQHSPELRERMTFASPTSHQGAHSRAPRLLDEIRQPETMESGAWR